MRLDGMCTRSRGVGAADTKPAKSSATWSECGRELELLRAPFGKDEGCACRRGARPSRLCTQAAQNVSFTASVPMTVFLSQKFVLVCRTLHQRMQFSNGKSIHFDPWTFQDKKRVECRCCGNVCRSSAGFLRLSHHWSLLEYSPFLFIPLALSSASYCLSCTVFKLG